MSSVTFLYHDNGVGKEEIYLSKEIIEIINYKSQYKIYFGLVLIDSLSKVISSFEVNQESSKLKEIKYQYRINENYNYKLYKMFIEKIMQSKLKNISSNDLKEYDFVKGIYAVTIEGIESNSIIYNLNDYLAKENKLYIGYCCFDNKDKLIKILLYDNMYDAVIISKRLELPDNIYFQDGVIEIIGEDKCRFIDSVSSNLVLDEVRDNEALSYKYNNFDNFWDNFTAEVFNYVSKNNIVVGKNVKIQSDSIFDFSYLNDITGKLTEYCLNYNHDKGKNKAKVFESVLNIKISDYKFLKKQIKQGFIFNKIKIKNIDKYGIGFEINIPILGKNNRKVWIKSGWKYKDNEEKFHLTTAYIQDEKKQGNIENMNLQLWVDFENYDDKYYFEIYNIAEKYRKVISNNYILKDNKSNEKVCIQIRDDNFGDWLMINHKAEKYKGNIVIFGDSVRDIYSLAVIFEINDISTKIIDV